MSIKELMIYIIFVLGFIALFIGLFHSVMYITDITSANNLYPGHMAIWNAIK
jgi:hypothetical protein